MSVGETGEAGKIRNLVDVVQRWSVRIAQRVAPAEADFAAEVGSAYAAGGQERKDLLPRPGAQPGAFGPGIYALELPLILRALADAGKALMSLLGSTYLNNALAAAALLVAVRASHGDGHASEPERPAAPATAGPEPPTALPASEGQAVELAFASLRDRLEAAGFPRERADKLAWELLGELLTNAAEAAVFVDTLAAVPDGGAGTSAKAKGKRARRGRRG
jgi:hypothetical protein